MWKECKQKIKRRAEVNITLCEKKTGSLPVFLVMSYCCTTVDL